MRGTWYVVLVAGAASAAPRQAPENPRAAISAMLARSAADWNRGDLAGFMSDYANDSLTTYVSQGHLLHGWQALYDRYQKAYFAPGKVRDSLAFEEVHVRPLGPDAALCSARFKLLRANVVTASGPFTLVLERRAGRWYIVHDHTSSDPTP